MMTNNHQTKSPGLPTSAALFSATFSARASGIAMLASGPRGICTHLAIWAIESFAAPGSVGWWAISGDAPTDYVSFHDADHPRDAMRHFSRQWAVVSSFMLRGEPHPERAIGTPDQWPELGDLLRRRSQLLQKWADDDAIWSNRNA